MFKVKIKIIYKKMSNYWLFKNLQKILKKPNFEDYH